VEGYACRKDVSARLWAAFIVHLKLDRFLEEFTIYISSSNCSNIINCTNHNHKNWSIEVCTHILSMISCMMNFLILELSYFSW
jgi:hypothetical protein